jgi:hypothetical protein
MGPIRACTVRAADVHAATIKVHVVLFRDGLWRRYGRGKRGTGRGVVVGRIEGRCYRVRVVHVGKGRAIVHERRAHGGEAEILLERARGGYYRVVVELERVDGEGHLWLSVVEAVHRLV